jgi:hypothetical protein
MIPGFEAGVKSMRVGGRRRVIVPPDLGPPARARREAATSIALACVLMQRVQILLRFCSLLRCFFDAQVGPSTFFSAKQFEVFDVELLAIKTCTRQTSGMFSTVACV